MNATTKRAVTRHLLATFPTSLHVRRESSRLQKTAEQRQCSGPNPEPAERDGGGCHGRQGDPPGRQCPGVQACAGRHGPAPTPRHPRGRGRAGGVPSGSAGGIPGAGDCSYGVSSSPARCPYEFRRHGNRVRGGRFHADRLSAEEWVVERVERWSSPASSSIVESVEGSKTTGGRNRAATAGV
jgi:hypothetical protein